MLKLHSDGRHWIWIGLWGILIAAALYSRPPIPIDETRYLSVAWEMWQRGDFLVPHINGLPYSQKPPLLFWLIQLVWAVFGVSETSARLLPPVFGLASIVLTIRLAGKIWPDHPQIGITVPYIMLGTFIWSIYSSLTMFDTLLTTLVLLCLHSIHAASRHKSATRNWLPTGLFLGLGILAKGPVVFVYVLPSILFAPLWVTERQPSWLRWYLGALLAIITGIAIALCWALPAASAGGEAYANAILLRQTAGRVVHAFAHGRPFYWYLILLPLLFFPWFFNRASWRMPKNQWQEAGTRFCIITIVAVFVILSCISGKQIHYILPVLPVAALLICRNLANMQTSQFFDMIPIGIILIALAAALLLLPVIPLKGGDREILTQLPTWLFLIPIITAVLLFLAGTVAIDNIAATSCCSIALFVMLHLALKEPLHYMYSQEDVGKLLEHVQQSTDAIAVFPTQLSDQFQFAGKLTTPLYPAASAADLHKWASKHPRGYSLIYSSHRRDLDKISTQLLTKYKNGWLAMCANSTLIKN